MEDITLPLPINQEIIDVKLSFTLNEDGTINKTITDFEGNILLDVRNILISEDDINKEYFDDMENQLKDLSSWNIVEVERFI
jgi:hypothetical protein